jgi:hypothetical protein
MGVNLVFRTEVLSSPWPAVPTVALEGLVRVAVLRWSPKVPTVPRSGRFARGAAMSALPLIEAQVPDLSCDVNGPYVGVAFGGLRAEVLRIERLMARAGVGREPLPWDDGTPGARSRRPRCAGRVRSRRIAPCGDRGRILKGPGVPAPAGVRRAHERGRGEVAAIPAGTQPGGAGRAER